MALNKSTLHELLAPAVQGLGYELVGIQFAPRRTGGLLRIYIDHEGGITVDDCERVSHQVSGVLDVENPIAGQYVLEVSSPGLDRPLFEKEHYIRFVGRRVSVRLHLLVDGRRNFLGVLQSVDGDMIAVEDNGVVHHLPLSAVHTARLVPDL